MSLILFSLRTMKGLFFAQFANDFTGQALIENGW